MSSTPFMLRVISASVCAANKSGAIIREILKTGELGIVNKVRQESVKMFLSLSIYIYILHSASSTQGVNDPQTEADRRAQRCISATLQGRFPGITLIGEEVRDQLTSLHTRPTPLT